MLLGKRPRHPMKRTTSMTEFTLDLNIPAVTNGEIQPSDLYQNPFTLPHKPLVVYNGVDRRLLTANGNATSKNHGRRNSVDFTGTGHFLRSCALCKRRLVPGRDIYMYRGDTAFCSHECRQQQIIQDERSEKCSLIASKKGPSSASVAGAEGETVAAM